MKSETVSFVRRVPNFAVKSPSNAEFWYPTSIIPTLTPEPVSVEFELLCGLSLLYERVVSFHATTELVAVTVGLVVTGAVGFVPVSGDGDGVGVGVVDAEPPPPPPPPPQLINKADNAIRIDFLVKLYFLVPFF